jgi:VWFA-related protein
MARQNPAGAQAPPDSTFKAEVEYVEIDALVTNAQGQLVRTLRAEDFQVFEDGKRQKIANFALVDIPVRTPASGASLIDADVQTSERPFTGRVYVLVLDDLHTAASRSQIVRRAARQFINRYMNANDVMAIVYTDRRTGSAQDFTHSKRLLVAAVDRFTGQKVESATLVRNAEFFRSGPDAAGDPIEMERAFNARSALRVLRDVSEWLGRVHGRRKTVVFISEGIDYDISDVFRNRSATSIIEDTRDAIAAATRSNVAIYALDARTLTGVSDDAIEVGIFADQMPVQRKTEDGALERAPGINSRALENERRLSQDSLRTLADETNGFAAVTSADFADAFQRIVSDNSSYYVLAYYPPSAKRDGRFHRIDVRTTNPALQVRARRGYAAPRGNPSALEVPANRRASAAVLEALNNPIPANGMALRVFASPFRGTAAEASIVLGIELRGRDLPIQQSGEVELSFAAVDAFGKTRDGDTQQFTLALPQNARAQVEQHGLQILNRLSAPPGRYQVRVAARNAVNGALGSVSYDLEVPDFGQLPLSMSGVVLTSVNGPSAAVARGDEQLQKMMPAPPVFRRTFTRDDELLLFAEFYDRQGSPPHTVDIRTSIDPVDGGAPQFRAADERSSQDMYPYTVRIPLSGLSAGRYVLTVEAASRLGPKTQRQIPFEISAGP